MPSIYETKEELHHFTKRQIEDLVKKHSGLHSSSGSSMTTSSMGGTFGSVSVSQTYVEGNVKDFKMLTYDRSEVTTILRDSLGLEGLYHLRYDFGVKDKFYIAKDLNPYIPAKKRTFWDKVFGRA